MNYRCLYDKLVDPKKLKPHPKNRNSHPQDQIDRLAKIIEYQGWRYPVKVSNQSGFVTAGHGRIEVAKALKCKVPVNYQDYESDAQEYADIVADNAIASWSELDLSGINTDIGDLGPDLEIEMLGLHNFLIEPAEKFLEKDLWEDNAEMEYEAPDGVFKIIVSVKNEPDVKLALERLGVDIKKSFQGKRVVSVNFPDI